MEADSAGKIPDFTFLADFKPTFVSKKDRLRRQKEQEEREKKEKEEMEKLLEKKNKLYSRGLTGEKLQERLNGRFSQTLNMMSLSGISVVNKGYL